VFLTFRRPEVEPGEPFAHMVENRFLIDALVARPARLRASTLRPCAVSGYRQSQAMSCR
jgi:2-octaprenyl-6-methoxyphenol hydroxylase